MTLFQSIHPPKLADMHYESPKKVGIPSVKAADMEASQIFMASYSRGNLSATPLDFVPAASAWERGNRDGLVSYRPLFEQSLNASPAAVQRAQIPIEKAAADIVVVAGGDDALWPSDVFAEQLSRRR